MGPDTLNEREKKIRADVKAQFALKKECERRALAIVHRMLESPSVKEEDLKDAANSINPDFYRDIVIERGIASLCGYPLCSNKLPSTMSRQKYHVSTLTNTVYDITERVNFCSNHCFKASKYFANQVPSEPLWTRNVDEPLHISLLPPEDATSASRSVDSTTFVGTEIVMNAAPSMLPTRDKQVSGGEAAAAAAVTKPSAENCKNSSTDDCVASNAGSTSGKSSSSVDEYKSLVGEAKLEMIKHLLFDKESELKETMDFEEKRETEGGKDNSLNEDPRVLGAEISADSVTSELRLSNRHYPVILERNLQHGVETMRICEEDTCVNDVLDRVKDVIIDGGASKLSARGNASDMATDPFLHHVEVEKNLSTKHRSCRPKPSDPKLLSQKQQPQRRKKVSFCDSVNASDDLASRRSSTQSGSSDRNVLGTPVSSKATDSNTSSTSTISHDTALFCAPVTAPSPTSKYRKSPSLSKRSPPVHPLDPIWHVMRAWTTRLTVLHLWTERLNLNDQLERQKLEEKVEDIVERVEMAEKSSEERFDVGVSNLDVNRESKNSKSARKKPMPDFDQLKTEQAFDEEKVVEFFKASFKLPTSIEKVETERIGAGAATEAGNDSKRDRITLPPTDRLSQVTIRRKLVLDRLLVVLPDILSTIELGLDQVLDELKSLIETFNLESDTIIFRPGQWAVIAVMLLKMASIRNGLIWDRLHRRKSCDILGKALDEIGIRLEDVDNLVAILTNPETLEGMENGEE